ncbi:MAG TPA: hypothetical protein GX715_08690 [Armatimonadetes bacterium]|jgi:hypothetical protein|nr:hypothetical protein [Armatimonadota bacterium]
MQADPTRSYPGQHPQQTPATVAEKAACIRGRAVLLGLALIPPNFYWIVNLEVNRYSFATYAAPFYNVIFTLFLLTLANHLARRWRPALALNRAELLTIYAMLSIASALNSHNCMQILLGIIGHGFYFATPENAWADLFLPHLPSWLTVSDRAVLEGYYSGHSSFYQPAVIRAWAVPIVCWTGFGVVLLGTMLCINVLFRRQWVEAERLTYPIVQLPLEMTAEEGGFWRNRLMWIGFAIAFGVTLLNGFAYLFPSIPGVPIKRRNIGFLFTQRPWSAIGAVNISFYFFAIGLTFLMPLDISFSCWFFYWFHKMQLVLGSATGWSYQARPGGGFDSVFPYANSQAFGAYMAVFLMGVWGARHHFARVWRTARGLPGGLDDSAEPLRYRAALIGVAVGGLALIGFGITAGLTWWVAIVYFAVYFALAVLVCRIRAEVGLPVHDMHVMGPHSILIATSGTQALGARNLSIFSLFYWFNRTYASHPMPHQMEAFKLAERTGASGRRMAMALMAAAAVALPCAFWLLLDNAYRNGCATGRVEVWGTGFGNEVYNRLQSWTKNAMPVNYTSMGFIGGGFGFAMLLGIARLRLSWFPFHPLAYAVANSWGIAQLWLPMVIGSTAKLALLRFGGLKSYRAAIPFFLGLILGEVVAGSFWSLLGVFAGFRTYDFWP